MIPFKNNLQHEKIRKVVIRRPSVVRRPSSSSVAVRRRPSSSVCRLPSSSSVVVRRRPLFVCVRRRPSLFFFSWCDQMVFLGTDERKAGPHMASIVLIRTKESQRLTWTRDLRADVYSYQYFAKNISMVHPLKSTRI